MDLFPGLPSSLTRASCSSISLCSRRTDPLVYIISRSFAAPTPTELRLNGLSRRIKISPLVVSSSSVGVNSEGKSVASPSSSTTAAATIVPSKNSPSPSLSIDPSAVSASPASAFPAKQGGLQESRMRSDWHRAKALHAHGGQIANLRVEGSNNGGVLVRFGSLQAFLPYSQVNPLRWKQVREAVERSEEKDVSPYKMYSLLAGSLVGKRITAKVIDVSEAERRLVLSEKAALHDKALRLVKTGEIITGTVNALTEIGVFVDFLVNVENRTASTPKKIVQRKSDSPSSPSPSPARPFPLNGLIHVSEISWDPVRNIGDLLKVGDEVKAYVLAVDREKKRIALSLKRLEPDPLLQTLDTLLPSTPTLPSSLSPFPETSESADASQPGENSRLSPSLLSSLLPSPSLASSSSSLAEAPDATLLSLALPGLEAICEELKKEEGIESISLGRQAVDRRVVTQDLELWLSSASADGGAFTLLARAGRQVQEVYVKTSLDREGMKAAVQRVTGRVE